MQNIFNSCIKKHFTHFKITYKNKIVSLIKFTLISLTSKNTYSLKEE